MDGPQSAYRRYNSHVTIALSLAELPFKGGSIERWEDPVFRKCFESILAGDWPRYDPFDFTYRLEGNTDMYNRPNQVSNMPLIIKHYT
jgi:hypothetical protein